MANDLAREVREARPSAEEIARSLLLAMREHDPVEAFCALGIVASHYIVTVATEGEASVETRIRLQPDVQRGLLERMTELCQDARQAGAN